MLYESDVIDRAAEAMAGPDDWQKMDESVRRGWRELARRAAAALRPTHYTTADLIDDHVLTIKATLVLAKHAGKLTVRRADDDTRALIARDWVVALRQARFVVICPPRDVRDLSGLGHG